MNREEITVTLSDVELPTVSGEMLEDSIGICELQSFTMVTPSSLRMLTKIFEQKAWRS